MKKRIMIACLLMLIGITSCAAENINYGLNKISVYINGKKRIYYLSNEKLNLKKINIESAKNQYLVLYPTKNKNPISRLIVTSEIIVFIPKNKTIQDIEKKYNIKFVKFIDKKLKLALFKTNINNLIKSINALNKNGIKAEFNAIRNWKLY